MALLLTLACHTESVTPIPESRVSQLCFANQVSGPTSASIPPSYRTSSQPGFDDGWPAQFEGAHSIALLAIEWGRDAANIATLTSLRGSMARLTLAAISRIWLLESWAPHVCAFFARTWDSTGPSPLGFERSGDQSSRPRRYPTPSHSSRSNGAPKI